LSKNSSLAEESALPGPEHCEKNTASTLTGRSRSGSDIFVTLKIKVKNAYHFSHFTAIYGEKAEKVGFNEFLNDRRHLDAVTSDGKLFSKFLLQ